jgi:purine-nucleoside phosphorylase
VKRGAGASLGAELAARGFGGADAALVLGSGLGGFARRMEQARSVTFAELAGMPESRVPGHAGRFVDGHVGRVRVLVQEGRVHLYEGHGPEAVTRAVRAYAELGIPLLVLTNAAGGVREEWEPGTLMRVEDHINLTGCATPGLAAPLAGSPYDERLGAALEAAGLGAGVELARGIYAGFTGPAYETPAEVRMARWMGADAVGMSTVLEAAAAAAAGMRVAALSCITNRAAGISGAPLAHAEVLEVGRRAAAGIERLLAAAIPELAAVSR